MVVDSMAEATLAAAMGVGVTPVLMVMEDTTITAGMSGPTIAMVTHTLITRTCAMTLITDTTGLRTLAIEATNFGVIAGLFDQPCLWVGLPQRTPNSISIPMRPHVRRR